MTVCVILKKYIIPLIINFFLNLIFIIFDPPLLPTCYKNISSAYKNCRASRKRKRPGTDQKKIRDKVGHE